MNLDTRRLDLATEGEAAPRSGKMEGSDAEGGGGGYQPIAASGDRQLPLLGILPSLPAASLRRNID